MPGIIRRSRNGNLIVPPDLTIDELKAEYVAFRLRETPGEMGEARIRAAADGLGISWRTIYTWIREGRVDV